MATPLLGQLAGFGAALPVKLVNALRLGYRPVNPIQSKNRV
jgi:hypothetical protein